MRSTLTPNDVIDLFFTDVTHTHCASSAFDVGGGYDSYSVGLTVGCCLERFGIIHRKRATGEKDVSWRLLEKLSFLGSHNHRNHHLMLMPPTQPNLRDLTPASISVVLHTFTINLLTDRPTTVTVKPDSKHPFPHVVSQPRAVP